MWTELYNTLFCLFLQTMSMIEPSHVKLMPRTWCPNALPKFTSIYVLCLESRQTFFLKNLIPLYSDFQSIYSLVWYSFAFLFSFLIAPLHLNSLIQNGVCVISIKSFWRTMVKNIFIYQLQMITICYHAHQQMFGVWNYRVRLREFICFLMEEEDLCDLWKLEKLCKLLVFFIHSHKHMITPTIFCRYTVYVCGFRLCILLSSSTAVIFS